MVSIFQSLTGTLYEEADKECTATEDMSLVKATKNAVRINMTSYN